MKNWLSLLSGLVHKSARTRLAACARLDTVRRQKQLRLEFLEDRRQLAPGDISMVGNDLLAEGTANDDTIIIHRQANGLFSGRFNGTVFGPFVVPGVLRVNGEAGNDFVVIIGSGNAAIIDGGADNDYIAGSDSDDTLIGGLGDDRLVASGGNNTLWGDQENQQSSALGGDDIISSLEGNDVIYGGGGNDALLSGGGNDYIFAGTGNDLISAGAGNDRVYAGTGDDVAAGSEGDDLLVGNGGNDRLTGHTGRDMLIGGAGNDTLNGSEDIDLLVGRGLTNEGSTSPNDAGLDASLSALFATFVANPATPGLLTASLAATDGGGDRLNGFTSGDIFYPDQLDRLDDFNQPAMGTDVLEVFAGGVALPANTPVPPGTAALVVNGPLLDIVITGTLLSDNIVVTPLAAGQYDVRINGIAFGPFNVTGTVRIQALDGDDFISVQSTTLGVDIDGGIGNDYIAASDGDDTLSGGPGFDQINAGGGNNTVWGDVRNDQASAAGDGDKIDTQGGDDIVYGGGGNDEIVLGSGNDHGYGGAGDDLISGMAGNDELYGGAGNDTLSGYTGNDLLLGNAGNDRLIGHTGRDVLIGGLGADNVNGNEDADVVVGRGLLPQFDNSTTAGDLADLTNHNILLAWTANLNSDPIIPLLDANDNAVDTLYGFTGDDHFFADLLDVRADFRRLNMGQDVLKVFPGSAALPANTPIPPGTAALVGNVLTIRGTDLSDLISVHSVNGDRVVDVSINGNQTGAFLIPDDGTILITSGEGEDHISVIDTTVDATVDAGPGEDYVATSHGNDTIQGGIGDDQLLGEGGSNTIWGDVQGQQDSAVGGNDKISTLDGNDIIYGGAGNDELIVGGGNDYVFGGSGNDLIDGGAGNDRLYGGSGNDTIAGYTGDDIILGNAGNDFLTGNSGRDVVVGGVGRDNINGNADQDAVIGRSLTNEGSTTFNDLQDQAMAALIAQWVANLSITPSLGANDTAIDRLTGGTGIDDFYADVNDVLVDFRAPSQGLDRRIL